MARQNPPVLQPLKMVCSRSQHPLSSVSGRRRYNTLDFAAQNRVPTGRFRPSWKPRIQGIYYPLENPAVSESVPTSCKIKLVPTYPKTRNPQRVPPIRRVILWGSFSIIAKTPQYMYVTQSCSVGYHLNNPQEICGFIDFEILSNYNKYVY